MVSQEQILSIIQVCLHNVSLDFVVLKIYRVLETPKIKHFPGIVPTRNPLGI